MGRTVLIVDDEINIVDILSFNLKRDGFDIVTAYDGEAALSQYAIKKPDLILLDVMLPRIDGFEVCRQIREKDRKTPIIMLTAREEETDKVLGLDLGADDYITKPFSVRELKARVNANIRRVEASGEETDISQGEIKTKGLIIDSQRHDVIVSGRNAELTHREYELVSFLAASPGKVFSREELLKNVWQYEFFGDMRQVDVTVRRLREKIEVDPGQPCHVMTKRGVGYYFES